MRTGHGADLEAITGFRAGVCAVEGIALHVLYTKTPDKVSIVCFLYKAQTLLLSLFPKESRKKKQKNGKKEEATYRSTSPNNLSAVMLPIIRHLAPVDAFVRLQISRQLVKKHDLLA